MSGDANEINKRFFEVVSRSGGLRVPASSEGAARMLRSMKRPGVSHICEYGNDGECVTCGAHRDPVHR